jgi:hypothetical protein
MTGALVALVKAMLGSEEDEIVLKRLLEINEFIKNPTDERQYEIRIWWDNGSLLPKEESKEEEETEVIKEL